MIIKTSMKPNAGITLTQGEVETLKYAWTIIAEIGEVLGDWDDKWIAPATGEVVEMKEISRVLGILSAFAEESEWESEG